MRITTHNTPTGTDETYSNTSDTSDDQDEGDDDPIKKRPAIRFNEIVLRENFFFERACESVSATPTNGYWETENHQTGSSRR